MKKLLNNNKLIQIYHNIKTKSYLLNSYYTQLSFVIKSFLA